MTPDSRSAYVTNLAVGSVSQFDIDPVTGALWPKTPATLPSPAVSIAVTPDGRTAYVTGFGFVSQYDIDPVTGALSRKTYFSTGWTLLRIAVAQNGKSVYITIYANGGAVAQYDVSAGGALTPKTPAIVAAGTSALGVAVTRDGKSAYVAGGSDNDVLQYNVDPVTGALSPKTPATVRAGQYPGYIAVRPPSVPTSKDECKHDGWRNFPQFKNQGDCVSFVESGK